MYQYKSEDRYKTGNDVCYISEFTSKEYRRSDFVRIANGDPELADQLFYMCDWQHPESLMGAMEPNWIRQRYEYGEALEVWTTDHKDSIVPAHYSEFIYSGTDRDKLIVNWEGRFLVIECSRILKIMRLDITTFRGASSAGENVPSLKKVCKY